MEEIKLLDCTLRDGGYINDWKFGEKTIKSIIARLQQANTDYIEVGFLRNCEYHKNRTLFNNIREMKTMLPAKKGNTGYIAMALHSQYDVEKLEENDHTIDGIRVTFHDYDQDEGLAFCKRVKEKGYPVFVNPINIMGYSDEMLLSLLKKVNQLKPYGFSIVDTFGSMTKNELVRIYSLCENNLDEEILLGLHLHENMAQSFLLAQSFLEIRRQSRRCILDASLNGMGRVPGNLCIELIMDYLNRNFGKAYDLDPVLDAIEEHITPIKEKESWGYQAEYFLSAKHNLHRNYAEFLLSKGTLSSRDMHCLLQQIPLEKKSAFDKEFIQELYNRYEDARVADRESLEEIKDLLSQGMPVLLAPGKSLEKQWDQIEKYMEHHKGIPISVNFYFDGQKEGYAFFSNAKRFQEYGPAENPAVRKILTSNMGKGIRGKDLIVNYQRLKPLGETEPNGGILLLRLLALLGIKEAALAGFDGYQKGEENYLPGYFGKFGAAREGNNKEIAEELQRLGEKIRLTFLTPSLYQAYMPAQTEEKWLFPGQRKQEGF